MHRFMGLIAKFTEPEQGGTRHDFFDRLYNWDLIAKVLPPQPQLWYRDGWEPCKSSYIQQSKFDRYEYYTPEFRRWTYRLNYEMTIFSFSEGDFYINKAGGPKRYLTVNSKLLLMAGEKDEHDPFYKLYSSTVDVAKKMDATHGSTLFLKNTGHSIHDERPEFLAEQILNFVAPTLSSQQALR
jgi:pimeloyl-ACP methyl ester carboxylesterase